LTTLVTLGTYISISAGNKAVSWVDRPSLSENPELVYIGRSVEMNLNEPEIEVLAANPDLKYANRYREGATARMDGLFLASNPELSR
jgi:hypothetical protein